MENLIQWYNINKRNLPWRNNPTPYNIWVSEIILQQTQMSRGVQYYNNFIIAFPDVHSLAMADEKDVLLLWQGLGYYSRARNMLKAAKQIVQNHNGIFPHTYEALKSLQGVGDYTACAILSIAFQKSFVVVDANVLRIVSRLDAIYEPIESNSVVSVVKNRTLEMMSNFNPSDFNQGMMELGALVCKPKNPLCNTCPLSPNCKAYSINKQEQFPIKKEKPVRKMRFFHYFICMNNKSEFLLTQRKKDDVWKELYEFPLIETSNNGIPKTDLIKNVLGLNLNKDISPQIIGEKKHILTHREIHAIFYVVICNNQINRRFVCVGNEERVQFPVHNLMQYGFSALDKWMKKS